jgi:hypothetical protein
MQTSGAAVRGSFVVHGAESRNYTGNLKDVLGRMFRLGSTGCGFEQPLAATRRALRVNDGFLRTDASLAVVILADEDDCSVRDTAIFDAPGGALGDEPRTSFRCTRHGVICDEPLDTVGEKHDCRPDPDSRYLEDPEVTRADLASLKAQELLTVSAILGPPAPLTVELRQINGMPQLALAHSCTWQGPTGAMVADPPVRMAWLVDRFGSRGSLDSVCDSDYKPDVARIAITIKRSLGIACIDTSGLADAVDVPGSQPSCEARVVRDGVHTDLPRCPAETDCFDIVDDVAACPETADHARVVVDFKTSPAAGARIDVLCAAPAG